MSATSLADVVLGPATPDDAAALARIYNHYVRETVVTFEEEEVSAGAMAARLREVLDAGLPWWVARRRGEVAGYACAGRWKARIGYRISVESSIYLDPRRTGAGLGTRLYGTLIEELRRRSLHSVVGGVALPNPASVALHERLGFAKVAHFREIGVKLGRLVDVAYWQKIL